MCKTTVIGSVVCVLVWATVSVAVDKAPPEMEGREPPREFVEVRNRIEKLRGMAREAEEKARRLWAEAEELERNLDRRFEDRPKPEQMDEMHARLAELKEVAARAKREGRYDEAAELNEEAKRIAEEIEARAPKGKKWAPPELAQRLEELRHMAREAKERGEAEKASHLWAEAEELERELGGGFERKVGRGGPEREEEMHRRLAELKEAAEHAERQGRHDEAARLGEEAHKLAIQLEKAAYREKMTDVDREIERLHAMAAQAKEAGQHEKAEAILREAKSLQRRDKARVERPKEGPPVKDLMHQIEMLREEVGRLRREVEQLRGERPDRDRPRERDRPRDQDRPPDRDRPQDRDRPRDPDRPRDRDR